MQIGIYNIYIEMGRQTGIARERKKEREREREREKEREIKREERTKQREKNDNSRTAKR